MMSVQSEKKKFFWNLAINSINSTRHPYLHFLNLNILHFKLEVTQISLKWRSSTNLTLVRLGLVYTWGWIEGQSELSKFEPIGWPNFSKSSPRVLYLEPD